jgi:hypothetical protein
MGAFVFLKPTAWCLVLLYHRTSDYTLPIATIYTPLWYICIHAQLYPSSNLLLISTVLFQLLDDNNRYLFTQYGSHFIICSKMYTTLKT